MRRTFVGTFAALAVAGALLVQGGAATAASAFSLFAGQDTFIGNVWVLDTSTPTTLKLRVGPLSDPWCMTQLHADSAATLGGIPQTNKGSPQVGLFEVNEQFAQCKDSYNFELPYHGSGTVIAVHLKVWNEDSETSKHIFSNGATMVSAFNGDPITPQNALPAYEPVGYQNCGSYKLSPATGSVWDTQNGGAVSNDTGGPFDGALWIWRTENPDTPDEGEFVTFVRDLPTPGWRTSGTIKITADNGYRVYVDGTQLGSAQVSGGFPPLLNEANVNTTGWQTPETYAIPGQGGDVTMRVIAANEKAWVPGGTEVPDIKTTGIGGTAGGVCPNPGALLFKVRLDYYSRSETAWAGYGEFGGASWATYFQYTLPD